VKLWQRLWLLFAVIWLVVAGLNVFTILAFSDEVEWSKAERPAALAILVPAALYLVLWAWNAFRGRKKSGSGSDFGNR
jgi:hypothetical protein